MSLFGRLRRRGRADGQSRAPRSLSVVLDAVVQHAQQLQLLLTVVGVLGLCLVPLLERKIDFDENALLAGSARPTLSHAQPSVLQAGTEFADSLEHSYNTFVFSTALQEALAASGFQVSNHTYTAAPHTVTPASETAAAAAAAAAVGADNSSSSSSSSGWADLGGSVRSCVNVHAVLHCPRGDGKEALVLVTPINHQHFATDFHQDPSGVRLSLALGHALMTHLAQQPWLAKEVIWLLPDASCGLTAALHAWTTTYQLLPLDQAGGEPSFTRGGVLQQALLVEVPTGSFSRVQVGLEGQAGQLPKLDMYWIYRWYSQVYVTAPVELPQQHDTLLSPLQLIHDTLSPLLPLLPAVAADTAAAALHAHLHKLQVIMQFMTRQARGLPTGAHAAFKGLGVDAATLRVLVRNDAGLIVGPVGYTGGGNAGSVAPQPIQPSLDGGPYSHLGDLGPVASSQLVGFDSALLQLGNVLEASLRSCSVLIERFHHSLFLYVLTGLNAYVSVERYIGPLVALICVLVLQAASISSTVSRTASRIAGSAAADGSGGTTTTAAAAAAATTAGMETAGNGPSSQRPEGDPAGFPGLQGLLKSNALQLPGDQASAAVSRQHWVSALQLVLLTHAAAVAIAAVVRSPDVLGFWGSSSHNAQLGRGGLQGVGVGLGLLLSLLLVGETVLGFVSGSSGSSGSSQPQSIASSVLLSSTFARKVLVVELSVAAAVLAAIACINWALGYVVCLILVPLALACSNAAPCVAASRDVNQRGVPAGPGTPSVLQKAARAAVLVLCSPLSLLLLLSVWAPGVGIAGVVDAQWLSWLVWSSSWGTYMVACGLYLPYWLLLTAAST